MSDMVDTLAERMGTIQQRARERGREARYARMRGEVLDRIEPGPVAMGRARPWVAAAAVGLVALVVALGWSLWPRGLTLEVDGIPVAEPTQAFFSASDDAPIELSFSNGSAVTLRPGAQVRVAGLRDDAADLVLEAGVIELRLRGSSEPWSLQAGPYRVISAEASGVAMWWSDTRVFELAVDRGQARVEGAELAGGDRERIVGAAERAVFGAPKVALRRTAREEEAAGAPVDDVPTPATVPPPSDTVTTPKRSRRPRAGHSSGKPSAQWRTLARAGEHARAMAAAEAAGFARLCDTLGSAALLDLADVARYAGQRARAREALRALRRRFAGTDDAATGAFDLGRMASRCDGASSWFQIYLDERPRGPMAEAARRRLDECESGRSPKAAPHP